MDAPSSNATAQTHCEQCQTVNAPTAKFCSSCGQALRQRSSPPPSPPSGNGLTGSILGGSVLGGRKTKDQIIVDGDPSAAYDQAVRAIQSAGGEIEWQSPPQSAEFAIVKTGFWKTGGMKIPYDGQLSVTQHAPRQSAVQVALETNWSKSLSYVIASGAAMVGIVILVTMLYPMMTAMLLPLLFLAIPAALGLAAWQVGSQFRSELSDEISKDIKKAIGASGPSSRDAHDRSSPRQTQGQDSVASPSESEESASPQTPAPTSPSESSAPERAENVFDQIQQLAQLRDAGAITEEEFETKKGELLSRL